VSVYSFEVYSRKIKYPLNTALKTGLLIGGALLAYNAFAKGNALQTLNFYPKKVSNIRIDGVTPVMTFGLAVQNVSNQSMVLHSLAGNLYANGILIGNVSSWVPTRINANSETVLQITVRLSLLGVVQDIIRAFNGDGWQQNIEFDARANVDRYNIPIKITYKVG